MWVVIRNAGNFCAGWVVAAPLSGRRAAILAGFLLLYPLFLLGTWIGMLADEVFFRRYRRQVVSAPVFILGNFRSGTTFLHRLLAGDKDRFATMCLWEILFAPSVCARCCWQAAARFHQWVGAPLAGLIDGVEKRWEAENLTHKVSLFEPEEDDYLMLHVFSSLTVGLSAGLPAQARPYAWFDHALTQRERRLLMKFYRRCLQRFLTARGGGRSYLAKAPALTPKIRSLAEEFPDAKFLVIVRNPREVLPSVSSMMRATWRVLGVPEPSRPLREFLHEMAEHWYGYPRDLGLEGDRIINVRYEDLVADPQATVEAIYGKLGFPMSEAYRALLQTRSRSANAYTSRHKYSIESEGFDHEILEKLARKLGYSRTVESVPPSRSRDPQ